MPLPDEWDALDAYLADPEANPLNEPDQDYGEPPLIEVADDANRLLRSLARLDRQEREVKEVVKAEAERINAFGRDRLAGIEGRRSWFSRSLEAFMRAYSDETGARTLTLSNGVLEIRPPAASVVDMTDAAIENLHDELVNRKPSLNKKAVQALYKPGDPVPYPLDVETGERLPEATDADVADFAACREAGKVLHYAVDKTTGRVHPSLRFMLDPAERFNWRTT